MRRNAVDIEKLGEAFWNAFTNKRMGDAKRHWDELIQTLGAGGDKVADSKTGDEDVRVAKVPEQLQAIVVPNKDLRFAMIADGETVLPRMSVCVIDNVAYAADGTNEARMATGICVRAGNKRGEIYWRPTGIKVLARVKRNTGVETYGTLYQSGTPGVLTNDPNESGLAYVQQVAHFRNWEKRRDGQRPSIAEVDIILAGRSGEDAPVTSVNGETGDVVLNYEDVDAIGSKDVGGDVRWFNNDGELLGYNNALGNAISLNPEGNGGAGVITASQFAGTATDATTLTQPLDPTLAGVPSGGTTGQVLAKNSNTDYDTEWVAAGGGGGGTDIIYSGTASEDIDTGELVHVSADGGVSLANGAVAYLWATHVAASTATTGNSVDYVSIGNYEVPTENIDAALYTNMHYLSDTTPGAASPKPPAIPAYGEDRKLWQEIGVSTELRGTTTTGKTTIAVDIKGPILL